MPDAISPRFGEVSCGTPDGNRHTLRWTEWGRADNRQVLVCAHGLSRNGRDFDFLAQALAARYRVVCPDYPGRGLSDPLADPTFYTNEQYVADSRVLLETLAFDRLDWVGTSMGGLIGMALAAGEENPVSRLVVNDVGPHIPATALAEIGRYLGVLPAFIGRNEVEDYFRTVYAGFGPLDDHHYRHLARFGVRSTGVGDGYVLDYDPAIIARFLEVEPVDVDLWPVWDAIRVPVLVIRGQQSRLLLPQTVERMRSSGAHVTAVEFPHCAHAPSLMIPAHIEIVDDWLGGAREADCNAPGEGL